MIFDNKTTIHKLTEDGELNCVAQIVGSGVRRYKYLGVTSPYLYDAADIKEWLKTFCVEVELTS